MDGFGQFLWTVAAMAAAANFLLQLWSIRRRLLISVAIAVLPVLYAWTMMPAPHGTMEDASLALTLSAFVFAFTLAATLLSLLAATSVRVAARALVRQV